MISFRYFKTPWNAVTLNGKSNKNKLFQFILIILENISFILAVAENRFLYFRVHLNAEANGVR